MTTLFLTVAEQSLRLSGIILCLWGLRAIFRKIPGSAWYLLWILIFVGLLLPCGWRFPITRKPRSFPPPPWFPPRMQALFPMIPPSRHLPPLPRRSPPPRRIRVWGRRLFLWRRSYGQQLPWFW